MWGSADVSKIYFVYKERKYIFAPELRLCLNLNKNSSFYQSIVRDRAGVARWAHNPKVGCSNHPPATKEKA